MNSLGDRRSITLFLEGAKEGDPDSVKNIWESLHNEIHLIAQQQMRRESPNHTIQPTELINEAFLDLFDNPAPTFENTSHFLATVAVTMQHFLINHARKKNAKKRGGSRRKIPLTFAIGELSVYETLSSNSGIEALIAIDKLETIDKESVIIKV